jgi:hypothetical protein
MVAATRSNLIPIGATKKTFVAAVWFRAAYNRRLLEIVVCAGNDCGRAGADPPKEAG